MFKLIFAFFLIVFLAACGVETSSSALEGIGNADSTTDSDQTDDNETDDTDTTGGDTTVESIFDTVGAIYDSKACDAGAYSFVRDASYNGDNLGENGSSYMTADGEGLQVKSEHLESSPDDSIKTWVTLFYKSFPDSTQLNLQGASVYRMTGVFSLAYDLAWVDESISGIDPIVYVRSDKTTVPSCYRVTLNSINSSEIDVQKVYR